MAILLYWKWKVGNSLAKFLEKQEMDYILCDDSDAPQDLSIFSSIIPSPGIPQSHKVYETNKVVSELDFLSKFVPKGFQIHAVTGTDGKSTTSWLLYHFLRAGFTVPVYLWGNFWKPFAEILLEISEKKETEGHIILEVSSFMAYSLQKFYAHNTILTNLHPDHLDWHLDIAQYFWAKLNLLAHTKNLLLYPETVLELVPELEHYPQKKIVMDSISAEHNLLVLTPETYIDITDRQVYGEHNLRNIFLSASLAYHLGISAKILSETLPTISALPHRLQQVSQKDGKLWIDDSKSTTSQSLYAALRAFSPQRVYLIAGGKDKWDIFPGLAWILSEYCEQCVAIGETKSLFLQACHEAFIPAVSVATMQEAVEYLSSHTEAGDIILLSPGCASFDMFQNYEDRARQFVEAIHASE